jgi:hypothetical protein
MLLLIDCDTHTYLERARENTSETWITRDKRPADAAKTSNMEGKKGTYVPCTKNLRAHKNSNNITHGIRSQNSTEWRTAKSILQDFTT